MTEFQRARSASAKQQREADILAAAASLGASRGIRSVTLTDIASAVGMHKSAMLRYFETREQIFLRLTGDGWKEWSADLRSRLAALPADGTLPAGETPPSDGIRPSDIPPSDIPPSDIPPSDVPPEAVASAFTDSLVARPMFCDLLAQAPLNLERNVSLESVSAFKLTTLVEVQAISSDLQRLLGLTAEQSVDVIATATSLAGAMWQMATPAPEVRELYRSDPRLAHAVVEVGPRLTRVLTALLAGLTAAEA